MNAATREQVRTSFYRAHRDQRGFASVAVRRDLDRGEWFLDVGVVGPVDTKAVYSGLDVRVKTTARAVNAVAPFDQVN